MNINDIFLDEKEYADKSVDIIKKSILNEISSLQTKRKQILDERQYLSDYFNELKVDELQDLVQMEIFNTKTYELKLDEIAKLGKQVKEPYFGRFDFAEEGEDAIEKFYVGIYSLKNYVTGEIIVYDWRAPISSLYYDCEPGECSFQAPLGIIKGIMLLKRKFNFKNSILVKVAEIELPSDDETLIEVLKGNSSSHMKTIIKTIQKEQNKIIRDYIEGVSVIQGCAGSGKTSIALHKAAYVLYNFRDKLKTQELVIISPNKIFSEYISSVLPDLGEDNISQVLPEDMIIDALYSKGESYKLINRGQSQELIMTSSYETKLMLMEDAKLKSGMEFRSVILLYCTFLSKTIFKPYDVFLDVEDMEKCIEKGKLEELFYNENYGQAVFKRISLMANQICSENEVKDDEILANIENLLFGMFEFTDIFDIYKSFFDNNEFKLFLDNEKTDSKIISMYDKLNCPDNKDVLWEDSCALALLNILLKDNLENNETFYLLADEAQDFSPIFLEILRSTYKRCNMLFVGDGNQVVYFNTGNFLDDIKTIIKKTPFREYTLTKSYRSTKQIMDFAHTILSEKENQVEVLRDGEVPQIISTIDILPLFDYINEMLDKGYENIAVLCKTMREVSEIKNDITSKFDDRVKVLPIYLAKGLEYDSVAVWQVNSENYADDYDAKLLYTACTRALHNLRVFYSGKISNVLSNII